MGYFGFFRVSWEGYKYQLGVYRKSPENFPHSPEFVENDIRIKMKEIGNENEQKALEIVLNDLQEIIPKKLSQQKQCVKANLLRSIIGLWSTGKSINEIGMKKHLYSEIKKRNPKIDTRLTYNLFPFALTIYDWHNSETMNLKKWYKETRKQYSNANIWKPPEELLSDITYNEALVLANEKEIIPKAEFDKHLIEIQNTFKVWRGREIKRKKNKKGKQSNKLLPI